MLWCGGVDDGDDDDDDGYYIIGWLRNILRNKAEHKAQSTERAQRNSRRI